VEAPLATGQSAVRRPIVASGGGGFSPLSERSRVEEHVVALARAVRGRERPRICFIGTATGDDDAWIARFHEVFADLAETSHLELFDRTVEDIPAFLLAHDGVWVGGGNTASMLAVWRAHGVDIAMRMAHEAGLVLAGRSAGSICWFEGGTTDSYGPTIRAYTEGLGFIPGSNSPHYDGEPERRPAYHALIADGSLPPGIAVDDLAAAVYDGPTLVEVVAAHPGPAAYRVEATAAGIVETVLPVRVLP
jgi:peptidase E